MPVTVAAQPGSTIRLLPPSQCVLLADQHADSDNTDNTAGHDAVSSALTPFICDVSQDVFPGSDTSDTVVRFRQPLPANSAVTFAWHYALASGTVDSDSEHPLDSRVADVMQISQPVTVIISGTACDFSVIVAGVVSPATMAAFHIRRGNIQTPLGEAHEPFVVGTASTMYHIGFDTTAFPDGAGYVVSSDCCRRHHVLWSCVQS